MIRKKRKKADAILTADWHIWDKQPLCRTDDFWVAQVKKMNEVSKLQKEHGCPVFHSGDLTEGWKISPFLLDTLYKHLPNQFHTVLGNHDLKNHSLESLPQTGINVLESVGKIKILSGLHWEQKDEYEYHLIPIKERLLLISHEMVWQGEKPWFDCADPNISKMFSKYPKADIILTGHNHTTFTDYYNGKVAINPGSLTRHKADQVNHKPCIFLYYADTNTIKAHYLKIEENVISRDHIEIINEKEDRVDAFLETLNAEYKVKASYEKNVERLMQINNIDIETKNKIRECM